MSCAGWLPLHKRGDCCMHSIGYALDGAGLLKGMVGLRVSLAECFFLYFLLFGRKTWEMEFTPCPSMRCRMGSWEVRQSNAAMARCDVLGMQQVLLFWHSVNLHCILQ